MPIVKVLTTGGTIATRTGADGDAIARASGEELLDGVTVPGVNVEVENVMRIGSFRMTLDRLGELAKRVIATLVEPEVAGVVVTHGTDTLEETAMFLDLFVERGRPVVLTGAQRAADSLSSDGSRNLRDAIIVAATTALAGRGVLITFDGSVFPARGTHKLDSIAATAFGSASTGQIGWVHADAFRAAQPASMPPALPIEAFNPSRARVDIVPCYPDADGTALVALVDAGARGLVLEGLGSGNANPELCDAVAEATSQGIVVVTASRVQGGPVFPIYADGGGADLVKAGAVPMRSIRPSHARILLASLLGVHGDSATVHRTLPRYIA
ncbi:MAG: asparaginase [Nocardioides sp.]|nr:asparaginase [Nocardioides sp.]